MPETTRRPTYFGIDMAVMSDDSERLIVSIYDEEVLLLATGEMKVPNKFGLGMVEEFLVDGEEFIGRLPEVPWWARSISDRILKDYASE
mgnify:CR=1 FL=1|tara:strand:- start:217 stop:483 length:267 start_codon:yes stop_codon:yes gene_type:complete